MKLRAKTQNTSLMAPVFNSVIMKQVSITINDTTYDLLDLGEQQLNSSHLRSDICVKYCDLMKVCGQFLYNAAVPCMLAMDTKEEGSGFYFKKRVD